MPFKLGRIHTPAHRRKLTPQLHRYLDPSVIASAPEAQSWSAGVPSWPMYANDQLGDCVIAAKYHLRGAWTYNASGREFIAPDSQVIQDYSTDAGYVPGDDSTDNGTDPLTAMQNWTKGGADGNAIDAFAEVEAGNLPLLRAAAWLFGGGLWCLSFPDALGDDIFDNSKVWDIPAGTAPIGVWAPNPEKGHGVTQVDYDANAGVWGFISWGCRFLATNRFVTAYFDQPFIAVDKDWIAPSGLAKSGFNLQQLIDDVAQVSG